eukprot:scaffold327659_cov140-Tisochrysis_lutea.AAC.1
MIWAHHPDGCCGRTKTLRGGNVRSCARCLRDGSDVDTIWQMCLSVRLLGKKGWWIAIPGIVELCVVCAIAIPKEPGAHAAWSVRKLGPYCSPTLCRPLYKEDTAMEAPANSRIIACSGAQCVHGAMLHLPEQ